MRGWPVIGVGYKVHDHPFRASLPLRSIDGDRRREGGFLREGIETRARRAKLFRGKLIRSRERAWNYRRWSVGEEERGGKERGRWNTVVDRCLSKVGSLLWNDTSFFPWELRPGPPRCEPPRVGGICASSLFLFLPFPFLFLPPRLFFFFLFFFFPVPPFLFGRVIN